MIEHDDSTFLIPEGENSKGSVFEQVLPAPSDKQILIWRYFDLAKLISLISEKKLHFSRADAFQDRHEGSVTNKMDVLARKQLADRQGLIKTITNFRKLVKESSFISCWSMASESEAMWKLYCGEKYGVAIAATYQEIEAFSIFNGLAMAPVRYLDYRYEAFPQDNTLYPFFHKRQAFAHEKEVRIIRWHSDQMPVGMKVEGTHDPPTEEEKRAHQEEMKLGEVLKAQRGLGIKFEFDTEKIIRKIVVHPYSPEWYFGIVKLVVEKFEPKLSEKVEWSSMRTEPLY